jgi:hypothetical protein
MQPKAQGIADIAMIDPIAAYGILLGVPRIPITINAAGSFSSFALDQDPIEAGLDTTISTRTWISNIQYSLQVPNCFTGSIFKPQFDGWLRSQTGVGIRMTVQSGPRYMVSPKFTPLENFICSSRAIGRQVGPSTSSKIFKSNTS